MGSGDVTGSTLPQWHQRCLPTLIPAGTSLRCRALPVPWDGAGAARAQYSSSAIQFPIPGAETQLALPCVSPEEWWLRVPSWAVTGGSGNAHYWHWIAPRGKEGL